MATHYMITFTIILLLFGHLVNAYVPVANVELRDLLKQIKATVDSLAKKCPDGWYKGSYNCYFMPFWKTTWTDAERYCNRYGAHLVSFESSSEWTNVKKYVRSLRSTNRYNSRGFIWLGGFDFYKEGTWNWVSGRRIGSSNWYPGCPRKSTSYNCMMMLSYSYGSNKEKWHDHPCTNKYNFLCEKEFT